MLADLVEVTTPEGIVLSGAYFEPATPDGGLAVDALLFFHGDGGHFYNRLYLDMGQFMAAHGLAFLAANRRGHDQVSNGVRNGPLAGYAFESVEESRADFAAWLNLLKERGHRRIAIGGHSGGAVRSTYALATERYPEVAAVVPVSPGEYDHKTVVRLHGSDFTGPYEQSERDVAEGRPDTFLRPGVPWGSMWTARTYIDCFNEDNRYSVTAHAANLGCPTLYVFGSEECLGGSEELRVCGAARERLEAAAYPQVQVKVIEGANHGYAGRERELRETVYAWIHSIG